jgi:hypothetical protein
LSKVIKAAKNFITTIRFLIKKTTWEITKMETGKNHTNKGTQLINIDGKLNMSNNQ